MKFMKKLFALLLVAILAVALCSCGSKNVVAPNSEQYAKGNDGYSFYDRNAAESPASDEKMSPSDPSASEDYSRKIIKTQYLTLETLSFDAGMAKIEQLVKEYGGYFSSSEVSNGSSLRYYDYYSSSNRKAVLSIRVPSESLEQFTAAVSGNFNVLSSRLSTEEITDMYYDLQAQLKAYKDQETRLLALEDKANTLQELLTIENQLTNVRSSINYISSRIQYYDKAVDMSFVNITLYEVEEYQEVDDPTYGERVGEAAGGSWVAFAEFFGDLFVGILWTLPFIILAAGITVLVIVLVKRHNKKTKSGTENK